MQLQHHHCEFFTQQNHTHVNVTERHVDGKYGEQYTESILQLCGVSHMDSGEYLCVASSGATTVTDPPIYLTVLPGAFIDKMFVNEWRSKQ